MAKYRSPRAAYAVGTACLLVVSALAGCSQNSSKPTAHLRGVITIKGQPLPANAEGTVLFRPTAQGMAKTAGVPIADGRYNSPETPVGTVTVYFSIQVPTGKMISDAGGPLFPEVESIVPAEAARGIKLTVTGDNADQNFNLE